jgi:carbamate kinase
LKGYIDQRKDELTDSMYLKLLASCKFLAAPGKSIWIITPDELEGVLSHDCGIQLVSDPE